LSAAAEVRGQRWVTSRGAISAIARVDPGIAAATFGNPQTIALGGWPGSTTGRTWASCAAFEADAAAGLVGDEVRAVMYDPEGWDATPVEERRDPIAHIERFGRLARANGWFSVVTPYWTLLDEPGAPCARGPGETRAEAYLRCRIPERAAPFVDCYETQPQRLQGDPAAYRAFVERAAAQARGANPRVVLLSGLASTRPSRATPEILFEAWRSVRDLVDGHYLSLGKRRAPDVAAAFLRMVAAA
jgi:hypothetical protein